MLFSSSLLVFAALLTNIVSAEDPKECMIYPKDGTNKDQVATITKDFEALIPDATKRYQSKSDQLGNTLFWWGFLTGSQMTDFQNSHQDSVAVVMPSDPSKDPALTRHSPVYQEKRAAPNKIEVIKDAVDDLKILSLPSGVAEKDPNYLGYYYDATAGQDTMVYVVDSGAAIDHHEFDNIRDQFRWIWAAPNPATNDRSDGDTEGVLTFHGTCMLSKIVGKELGTAPKAQITVVRTVNKDKRDTIELSLDALLKVYDDIKTNQAGKAVVISLSWGLKPYPDNQAYSDAYFGAMKYIIGELLKLDVIITNSAGNEKVDQPIVSTPQILAKDNANMIVNGGVVLGKYTQDPNTQTADWVKVSTISDFVICAKDPKADDPYDIPAGTSTGAAQVAGVIAGLLTTGTSKDDIPKKIYSLAYARKDGGPAVLYNGIDFRKVASGDLDVQTYPAIATPSQSASAPVSSTTSAPPQSNTPAPVAPYAQGTCSLHATEWALLSGDGGTTLFAEVRMFDNNHNQIGFVAKTKAGAGNSLRLNSKLEDPLVITPEERNDYIQFTLGAQAWPSSQDKGMPKCTVGGWDGTDNPLYRQMDCSFLCTWSGGKSSDGSN